MRKGAFAGCLMREAIRKGYYHCMEYLGIFVFIKSGDINQQIYLHLLKFMYLIDQLRLRALRHLRR